MAKPRKIKCSISGYRFVREVQEGSPAWEVENVAINSPKAVVEIMAPVASAEVSETFWLLALNAQRRLIGNAPIVITRGILNSSLVHPREVFRAAIAAGAAAVILVHNHPSGDPTPSPDDRKVTEQLAAAGRVIDIPVMDHMILGNGRYTSFVEAGLL